MNQKTHKPPNPEGRRNSSVSSFKKSLHRCLNLYSKYLLTTHPNKTFNKIVILLFITSCITIFACRERVTPPDTPQYIPPIVLSLEDVSCTDAFIRVKFVDTTIERSFILKRDGATVASVANSPFDTMLIDENLLPKRIYRYKAYRVKGGASVDSSIELKIETMDTTSHDFTWQIDTLGTHSSVLYDVAIINDTLAYAVGEIYHRDSSESYTFFNLAKWNGRQWTLHRVYYKGGIFTARWILAFSENDILIEELIHWNGTTFRPRPIDPMFYGVRTTKAWGTSSSDFYVVGNGGFIAHYDGARWRRLESGTNVDLLDVWGSPDGKIVWTCGYYDDKVGTYLFKYNGIKWEVAYDGSESEFIIRNDSISGAISSVFTLDKRKIFIATNAGVYESLSNITGRGKRISFTTSWFPGFPYRLRGNGYNDMFLSGNYYMLAHFNGSTMKYYENFSGYGKLLSLYQKGNLVFAVGYAMDPIHRKGIVIRGRR